MRCREARTHLSAQLDGALAAADVAQLDDHLARCANCRDESARYAQVRAQLRLASPAGVDLLEGVRERLAFPNVPVAPLTQPAGQLRMRPRRFRSLPHALTAAVVAASLVAFTLIVRHDASNHTPLRPSEQSLRAPRGTALLLAWTSGGLPRGATAAIRRLPTVAAVAEVRGDNLALTGVIDREGRQRLHLPSGAAIPIDALAVEPRSYAALLLPATARVLTALPRDGVILGATEARLRGVGPGARLGFGSITVRVAAVLPDTIVGGAEVIVRHDSPLHITTPRFVLMTYRGDRSDTEDATRQLLHRSVRFRAPGETLYLRHGDAVLPQALVKLRFGEFWYRERGTDITIDPAWVARNIVTVDLPQLGTIRCHRSIASALQRAFAAFPPGYFRQPKGAPEASATGFAPSFIAPGLGLSRHTWGIGVTLRARTRDAAVTIATMRNAGFVGGAFWLLPSPDYYEWVGTTR